MTRRAYRDVVFALMAIVGPAVAVAQDARRPTGFQTGTELVVEWPDPVLRWNAVTLATATAAGKDPVAQQRILGILHLAMFEAVNAIVGDFEPYLGSRATAPGAWPAAAVAAAHAVLTESLPAQATALDAGRASSRQAPRVQASAAAPSETCRLEQAEESWEPGSRPSGRREGGRYRAWPPLARTCCSETGRGHTGQT